MASIETNRFRTKGYLRTAPSKTRLKRTAISSDDTIQRTWRFDFSRHGWFTVYFCRPLPYSCLSFAPLTVLLLALRILAYRSVRSVPHRSRALSLTQNPAQAKMRGKAEAQSIYPNAYLKLPKKITRHIKYLVIFYGGDTQI